MPRPPIVGSNIDWGPDFYRSLVLPPVMVLTLRNRSGPISHTCSMYPLSSIAHFYRSLELNLNPFISSTYNFRKYEIFSLALQQLKTFYWSHICPISNNFKHLKELYACPHFSPHLVTSPPKPPSPLLPSTQTKKTTQSSLQESST